MEMNTGAGQVNNALTQLNTVTQSNAASAEEMSSSSEELARQAEQLQELVSFYKVEEDTNSTSKIRREKEKPLKSKFIQSNSKAVKPNKVIIQMPAEKDLDDQFEHI
jgi:methyl-accepting chemotaxis protein